MDVEGARRSEYSTSRLRVGAHVVDPRANTIAGPSGAQSVEPKVMDVLLELCARQGEVVSREALIDAVWGVQHGADESLTRAISLLRKALEAGPQGRRAIETFSKRGYRLNLEVREMGSEATDRGVAVAEGSGRRWPVDGWRRWAAMATGAIFVGLIVSTILIGGDRGGAERQVAGADSGAARIAIEPWTAARPELADVAQAGASALGVAYAQRGVASLILRPEEARRGLDVEFRVFGDVRKRSEELLISVRLTDFSSGEVLWATERTQDGVEAISAAEGVAAHLANVTECALSTRRRYELPMQRDAFAAWLRYCDGAWSDNYALATDAAERLMELTPDETQARVAYAKAVSWQFANAVDDSADAWSAHLDSAIDSVLEIDPGNIDVVALQAAMHPNDWEAMERAIRALESADRAQRDGNEDLHYFLLRSVGYLEAALRQAAIMKARLPGPTHLTEEAWLMSTAGMQTRALEQLDEVIRLYPENNNAYWRRFNILALSDDPERVEMALFQAERGLYPGKADTQLPCWRNYLLARLGRIEAEGALSEEACVETMHDFRARLHAALGQIDDALANTRLALEGADNDALRGNTIHLFYPEMAEVRRDPRFWRLVDDIGLVDFWQGYGRWPDFCSDRRVPVDCDVMADEAIAGRT